MDLNMAARQNVVWITGASSGIGYSLAYKLLQQGNIVIATARSISKLEPLRNQFNSTLHCYQLDVSNEDAVRDFCRQLQSKFTYIDTMILNAGICEYVEWPDLNLRSMHNNMNTNFWGVIHCIVFGIKILEQSEDPYIVAISSASHIVGLPRAEGYGASKAALHYFLQALQVELHTSKIKLSIVTPGFVQTELTAKNDFPMPLLLSVDKATDIILKGMQQRKLEIKFPFLLILVLNILSLVPDRLRNFLLSQTIRKK